MLPKTVELQATFDQLADQWERETAFDSFIASKAEHPAHRQIVALGAAVIPLILRRIERQGGLWYWTLEIITGLPSPGGIQPLEPPPWVAVAVKEVNAPWLKWGREQGYSW